jgi:SAM-dependent methyltransferase
MSLTETRAALAAEWDAASPRTAEEIATFYNESELLAADLEAWHATPERKAMTARIVDVARRVQPQRVLDVGAGTGADLSAIREALPDAWYTAVEPNAALRVWLFSAAVYVVPDILLLVDPYDLIICIDVLEHVADPEGLVRAMVMRLAPDGVLIERTATFDHSTPLHLAEHHGWTPDETLRELGLVPQYRSAETVWSRVALAPTVLLCTYGALRHAAFAECLEPLTDRGWFRLHQRGDALITRARSKVVSQWYRNATDSDVFLMLDDDVIFRPEDAERVVELAREKRGIACGAYPVHDGGHLACRALVPGETIQFGPDLPPKEILWAATGFMAVHRDVIDALVATLPVCDDNAIPWWPMFDTAFVRKSDGEFIEDPTQAAGEAVVGLSEDYAFCERARQLGFRVWLDPQAILLHMSETAYSVFNMQKSKVVPA